jgi:hypothetical protein
MRREPKGFSRLMEAMQDEGFTVPTTKVVCPCCDGEGSYVNPSIDGNGLSRDDIDEMGGDEFLADYVSGMYDVTCAECDGRNVVDDIDRDRATPEAIEFWDEWLQDEADYRALCAAEIRAGC